MEFGTENLLKWVFSLFSRSSSTGHLGHLKFPFCDLLYLFFPSWVYSICSFKVPFWLNVESQYSHMNLFPSWNVLICNFRLESPMYSFPQSGQSKRFLPSWTVNLCLLSVAFESNVSSQSVHEKKMLLILIASLWAFTLFSAGQRPAEAHCY